jgi:hypothetical protein
VPGCGHPQYHSCNGNPARTARRSGSKSGRGGEARSGLRKKTVAVYSPEVSTGQAPPSVRRLRVAPAERRLRRSLDPSPGFTTLGPL